MKFLWWYLDTVWGDWAYWRKRRGGMWRYSDNDDGFSVIKVWIREEIHDDE